MENEIEWHGKAPNRKEMEQALRELGGHQDEDCNKRGLWRSTKRASDKK